MKNNIEGKTLATATNSGEVRATLTFKAVQLPPQIRERIIIKINEKTLFNNNNYLNNTLLWFNHNFYYACTIILVNIFLNTFQRC